LAAAGRQEAGLIRSVADTNVRIPHSDWTVRDAAAHNIAAMNWFREWSMQKAVPIQGSKRPFVGISAD
jgi:hypothetical protein